MLSSVLNLSDTTTAPDNMEYFPHASNTVHVLFSVYYVAIHLYINHKLLPAGNIK